MDPVTRGPVVDDTYMTSAAGIFACGNGLHVHDLVDYVTLQAERAAEGAVSYLNGNASHAADRTPDSDRKQSITKGEHVTYVVPSAFHPKNPVDKLTVYFRVDRPIESGTMVIRSGDAVIRSVKKRKLMPSVMEEAVLTRAQMEGLTEAIRIEVVEDAR